MKAILIATHPEWIMKMASGEKETEVRKDKPKEQSPFKCYLYCTKTSMTKHPSMYSYLHINSGQGARKFGKIDTWGKIGDIVVNAGAADLEYVSYGCGGKVVGEFVCDKIETLSIPYPAWFSQVKDRERIEKETCLTLMQLHHYLGGRNGYGWHISNLKIYDKPKELSEFEMPCTASDCHYCKYAILGYNGALGKVLHNCDRKLKRPPQSWCYVEDLDA